MVTRIGRDTILSTVKLIGFFFKTFSDDLNLFSKSVFTSEN